MDIFDYNYNVTKAFMKINKFKEVKIKNIFFKIQQ